MKAVILAAGEGRRLRPFTETRPKVMLPVANKPILGYVVDAVLSNGIDEIILVVGYKKEAIMDYFKDYKDIHLTYVIQDKQLGTAHALYQVQDHIDGSFLVLPGDNIIDGRDIAQLIQKNADYAIMVKEHTQPSKYGMVSIKGGLLDQFIEKSKDEHSHIISTGIYKFPSFVFKEIEQIISQGDYALSSVIQSLIEKKQEIHTIQAELWRDVIYPWDLLDVNDVMLRTIPSSIQGIIEKSVTMKGPVYIGEHTQVHSGTYIVGPVVIGKHCEIGPNVCIFPS
ncbi:MAG: sugar phosphate nucleotidyltransferase, partial [Candidatus Thermoplasmatota archaeon]|nr:sugar phosphate nucleotidyltransferase [Candidatus Thermoplasmatota archaeon]